jgi:hypothetical protein
MAVHVVKDEKSVAFIAWTGEPKRGARLVFLGGRPSGRSVCSKSSRRAVRSVQASVPKGRFRMTLQHSRFNSPALSAELTRCTQSAGRSMGHSARISRVGSRLATARGGCRRARIRLARPARRPRRSARFTVPRSTEFPSPRELANARNTTGRSDGMVSILDLRALTPQSDRSSHQEQNHSIANSSPGRTDVILIWPGLEGPFGIEGAWRDPWDRVLCNQSAFQVRSRSDSEKPTNHFRGAQDLEAKEVPSETPN